MSELHVRGRHSRSHIRRTAIWVLLGTLLGLIAVVVTAGVVGNRVYAQAMDAKSSLEQAMPLASTVRDQILSGDTATSAAAIEQLTALTADARAQTDDGMWRRLEWLPMIGDDLRAIRVAAEVTDDLATAVIAPASELTLNALRPVDGAVDLAAIARLQSRLADASTALDDATTELAGLDRRDLLPQVDGALMQLTEALGAVRPVLGAADEIIGVLPAALGADAPRTYLLVFQNNAESRSTGGIPAAFALVTADAGELRLTQSASSADFRSARPSPIIPLDPGLEGLYGDKVGRWVTDATMSPDFSESVDILRVLGGVVRHARGCRDLVRPGRAELSARGDRTCDGSGGHRIAGDRDERERPRRAAARGLLPVRCRGSGCFLRRHREGGVHRPHLGRRSPAGAAAGAHTSGRREPSHVLAGERRRGRAGRRLEALGAAARDQ
nr:DUF4012 domain-containing protein [Microbacterium ihumii]